MGVCGLVTAEVETIVYQLLVQQMPGGLCKGHPCYESTVLSNHQSRLAWVQVPAAEGAPDWDLQGPAALGHRLVPLEEHLAPIEGALLPLRHFVGDLFDVIRTLQIHAMQ